MNPVENLWSIVKMKLFEGGKQYNSKADLCEAIKTTMLVNESTEVKKITKLMDNRLLAITEKKGLYLNVI